MINPTRLWGYFFAVVVAATIELVVKIIFLDLVLDLKIWQNFFAYCAETQIFSTDMKLTSI